jgi:protein required for attachment to host cells
MITDHKLCILIADGEHARFVGRDADNGLHTISSFDSATAHLASRDLGSDRPGRAHESATASRHAVAPRHDPHDLEKAKFALFVARQVDEVAASGAFDALLLVAPARALGEIDEALDRRSATMVVGRLAKDLVKVPDHELGPHLAEWVPPLHRAK